MTDIDMYMPRGGVQGHAGQATMVEASRAMEEVRAQVIVARQFPRDIPTAIRRIEDTFKVRTMADRSFYSYRRGGSNVAGSTIHLAKAVAQAWGNLTYGIDELSRTPGQSEMRSWAWDLETNQRTSTTFIVQHAMDAGGALKDLTDLRSIYENNTNMANRRLRTQIESVIPSYVMDLARDVATNTLKGKGTDPLPVRIDKAVKAFAGLGVQLEQIEQERGRPASKWTDIDLGQLRVLLSTINRGEMTVAEAFPPADLSPEDARPVAPVSLLAPDVVDVPLPEERPNPDVFWSDEEVAEAEASGLFKVDRGPWPAVRQPGSER